MRLPRSVWRVAVRALALVGLAAPLAACDFLTGVPSVSRVELTVTPLAIAPNQTAQATGVAISRNGRPIGSDTRPVNYQSSNPAVATINAATGQIFALTVGTTDIVAEADGKRASVTLTVRLTPVRNVVITSTRQPTFRRGITAFMTAVALDSVNQQVPNRPIAWRSADETIATITSAGQVTPRAVGTTQIFASVDNGAVFDSTTIRVTEVPILGGAAQFRILPIGPTVLYVGDSLQFSAAIQDSTGATVTGRTITWTSQNPQQLRVTETGLGIALVPTSRADAQGRLDAVPGIGPVLSATTSVEILARAARVSLPQLGNPPAAITLANGATRTLLVQVVDAGGTALAGRRYTVTSNNPLVATTDQAGATTASQIVVTAGTVSATSTATLTFQALDNQDRPQGAATTLTVTVTP